MTAEPTVTQLEYDGEPALRFRFRYAQSVQVLWKHLVDPGKLKDWFPCELDILPRAGTEVKFTFPGERPSYGEVLEAAEPRLLSYTWEGETIRWELEPDDDGCMLTLINTIADPAHIGRSAAGWHFTLMGLDDYLNERPIGQDPAIWDGYVQRYEEQFLNKG